MHSYYGAAGLHRQGERKARATQGQGGGISSSLLLFLVYLQREQIKELVAQEIYRDTEKDGRALVSLRLERSTTWKARMLYMFDEVGGQTWKRLGREVTRGRLGCFATEREVVRRGRREDLRAVWGNTGEARFA